MTEPETIVLMQSSGGIHSPPKYEHQEQFLCSIDGLVQTKLVPHVYRQEVYAGGERKVSDPTAPESSEEFKK